MRLFGRLALPMSMLLYSHKENDRTSTHQLHIQEASEEFTSRRVPELSREQ